MFLDLSKAFDSTWTLGLLYKLATIGVEGSLLTWFTDFLSDRMVMIDVNGTISHPRLQTQGVPQGSVISPTLFNIYLHDFPHPPSRCLTLMFADDITVVVQADTIELAQKIVQPYLDRIQRWASEWKLEFSASKSCTLLFSRKLLPQAAPNFILNNTIIPIKSNTKFRGHL